MKISARVGKGFMELESAVCMLRVACFARLAAAFGLIAALGRPWYAAAPVVTPEEAQIGQVQGPVEQFFSRLAREFTTAHGTTGWDAFTSTDTILTVLVVIASGLCHAGDDEGAERIGLLGRRLDVADPHLDRPEAEMWPHGPPDLRVLDDRVRAVEHLDVLAVRRP